MSEPDSIRPAGAGDAVDGVQSRFVAEPQSGQALATLLAGASREGRATVIRGGGTKLGWGRPPKALDLIVSTARLDQLLVHRDGDLTATVGAGVTLAHLNRQLGSRGQWLPVESAFEGTTIGGLIATNDCGPLRHRYGTPRDLLIGITLALTDGHVVKAGGTVVKNVAGYDLGKLMSGSFGTYAAIVDATFKLLPIPHASSTLVSRYASLEVLAGNVAALAASQLEPLACDVHMADGEATLLIRFASSPVATHAQLAAARTLVSGETTVATGDVETGLWADQARAPWGAPGAIVRLSWLPSKLATVLTLVREIQGRAARGGRCVGRAIVGAGFVSIDGTVGEQVDAIERLRASSDVGHVVVLRASREVKEALDVWGPHGDSSGPLTALKRAFDPAGILNAARGPI